MVELNKKEKLIFYFLVRNYINEGKPQGSKVLAKKIYFKISPPTLRVYFRRLFKRGLIIKRGVFGGRIPTDKGWKYYLFNFKNKPEINLKEKNLVKLLKKFVELTHNVVIYKEKNSLKFLGLNNISKLLKLEDNETIEDILKFVENFDEIDKELNNQIVIKIGKEIKNSKSKNICLAIFKNSQKTICFLGPKRNYYHTLWSLLNKISSIDE